MSWARGKEAPARIDAGRFSSGQRQVRMVSDEWDAMREVHDILSPFTEAERLRILEAVSRSLGDTTAAARHGTGE